MTRAVRRLWREHRVLFAGFIAALCVTAFFLVRTVVFAVYWSDPAQRDQAIEGWMPVRYVALSWDVPPSVLADALQLPAGPGRRQTIAEIAVERGESIEQVAERLDAAVRAHRDSADE